MAKKARRVLICSYSGDNLHIDGVIAQLAPTCAVETIYIDDIVIEKLACIRPDQPSILVLGQRRIALDNFASVWVRKPYNYGSAKQQLEPLIRHHFDEEITAFMMGLFQIIKAFNPQALWVNDPAAVQKADAKLFQLYLATKIGFTVPETVIGNQMEALESLVSHSPSVIKMLSSELVSTEHGLAMLPTQKLTPEKLKSLSTKLMPPTIVQAKIQRAFEVRVTVVGEQVFAARIDTTTKDIDWRIDQSMSKTTKYLLDSTLQAKCLNLTRELGLVFGAIDLIVDQSGEHYFLEINPNGQWKWVEQETGMDISGAIASYLGDIQNS